MKRFRIKIAGASGGGILSTGEMITKALKNLGYYVVAEREYPSVIKGGHACFNINISDSPIKALREKVNVLMSVDLFSLQVYFDCLENGGVLVHGNERVIGIKELAEKIAERGTRVVNLPARTIALDEGGNVLMVNVVLIGMLWKAMGLKYEDIEREVTEKFKDKPRLLAIDLKCLKAGYDKAEKVIDLEKSFQESFLGKVAKENNFEIVSHTFEVYGL